MSNGLIGYCGLYCGACSFKVAFEENDRDHITNMPPKYEEFRDKPLEFCPGCRLENQCGKCDIKDCAEEKKLECCSLCEEFPCVKLENFRSDGVPHHSESIQNLQQIKKIGAREWGALQNKKLTCECGAKYSWYFTKCKKCNSSLY